MIYSSSLLRLDQLYRLMHACLLRNCANLLFPLSLLLYAIRLLRGASAVSDPVVAEGLAEQLDVEAKASDVNNFDHSKYGLGKRRVVPNKLYSMYTT